MAKNPWEKVTVRKEWNEKNVTDLLSKAPRTQSTIQNKSSDLTLILSDDEKQKFEEKTQEDIRNFVEINWEFTDEIQETKVISALVNFVISLYNHIATKTNYQPKNKRRIIKTLQNVLSNLDSIESHEWLVVICKELDGKKLPKLAQKLFYDIIWDEEEFEENEINVLNLQKLANIIKTMPY